VGRGVYRLMKAGHVVFEGYDVVAPPAPPPLPPGRPRPHHKQIGRPLWRRQWRGRGGSLAFRKLGSLESFNF
jgi:hypothetical protein